MGGGGVGVDPASLINLKYIHHGLTKLFVVKTIFPYDKFWFSLIFF